MKKVFSVLLSLAMVFSAVPAYAQTTIDGPYNIPASGIVSLGGSGTLSVTIVNASGAPQSNLWFDAANATIGDLGVKADEFIKLDVDATGVGNVAVILSTDNIGDWTGDPAVTPDGMLNSAGDVKQPLFWTVFPTLGEADSFTWVADPTTNAIDNDNPNQNQFYVVDRSQPDWGQVPVLQYASPIVNIDGQNAELSNVPWGNAGDPNDPPRTISNGTAYVSTAVDYQNAPADTYGTNTFTAELVTY